ncbi:MAG: CvpA family protein [Deltaproteobacteria bacterium]|nr:CvpA family protein [Deltaproteobacteria bacterium]
MAEVPPLNLFDLIFIFLTVSFFLMCLSRGGAREIIPFLGVLFGFVGANKYHTELGEVLKPLFGDIQLAMLMSFLVILMGAYILGLMLGNAGDRLNVETDNPANRILGGMIGIMKGVLFSLSLFIIVQGYLPHFNAALGNSRFSDFLAQLLKVFQTMHLT